MAVASQRAVQSPGTPVSAYSLHVLAAGQLDGQAPGAGSAMAGSQDSRGASTTPLPHTNGQSVSTLWLPPSGQQESPPLKAVMGVNWQRALQVPPDSRLSVVQALLSSQRCGQAPADSSGM